MKTEANARIKICPYCGNAYHGASALSRADGKTSICPDCGTREALNSIGVAESEQEKIIDTIHKYTGRRP